MINADMIYKWGVFAYITTSIILYLVGAWPFTQSIVDKSWLSMYDPGLRYFLVTLLLIGFLAIWIGLLTYTLKKTGYNKDLALLTTL